MAWWVEREGIKQLKVKSIKPPTHSSFFHTHKHNLSFFHKSSQWRNSTTNPLKLSENVVLLFTGSENGDFGAYSGGGDDGGS
ncbi:hypothetical protein SDJN02_20896 [Cucurbita argyrosperma subsp. argyrosperma]|nr:hypothetical protein SDJN02_20896 [Cucurbita argyrosperma subsp. argyrosperma]